MYRKKNTSKKIGILGGTFDPPHNGHLKISKFSLKKLNLNFLVWAVTKKNPFKNKSSMTLEKRIKYAKKINQNNLFIKVKYFENKIKSNRTIDLINYLTKKKKNQSIYFIIGADNLINFHKWEKYKSITNLCKILVFDRDGFKAKD